MLTFKKNYFTKFLLLFLVEICIAVFVKDKIIRPFLGDFLVVICLFYFFMAFLNFPKIKIAIFTLLFSYGIETLQYFDFIHHFNLENHRILVIILGSTFDWKDILAYTLGTLFVLFLEKKVKTKS